MMVETHSAVHGYYWRRKAHAPGLAVSPCALVLLCIYAPQGPSARAWFAAPAAPASRRQDGIEFVREKGKEKEKEKREYI